MKIDQAPGRNCLGIELSLEAVETVHTTLALSGGRPELESQLAAVEFVPQVLDGRSADVLHTVAETLHQVGKVTMNGTLVLHGSRHALGNLDGGRSAEVSVVRTLLHSVDGAHTTVALEADAAVGVKVLAWSLLGASQEASAHRGASTQGKRLHDVARAANAAICQDRDSELTGELSDVVDGRGLGSAAGADFLCGADGADAHPHSESVGAAVDEILRLTLRHDVASDDLHGWEVGLDPPDHVVLEDAVSLAGVDDDGIDPDLHELAHAVLVSRASTNGGGNHQLLLRILRREGEVGVLLEIGSGHQSDELSVGGDDGELALLAVLQDLIRICQIDALGSDSQVLQGGHQLAHQGGALGDPIGVALCDEAEELGAHLAVLGHRESLPARLPADLFQLGQCHGRSDADGVQNEAGLEFLHLLHLLDLVRNGQVRVNNSNATFQSHGDGHPCLCDGVHGSGDDGCLQPDVAGEVAMQFHIGDPESDVARQANDVIVGVTCESLVVLEEVNSAVSVGEVVVGGGAVVLAGGSATLVADGGHGGKEGTSVLGNR
mmetsp:Transcript_31015/g.66715  ORF Transcript_31015/g.66715 Transcript_31015/m.66715 type:complete len:550 (-) Transcript_31015:64-1713(-)